MTFKKEREQSIGYPGWKRFWNNQQDYPLDIEEANQKKFKSCYGKNLSFLLVVMCPIL